MGANEPLALSTAARIADEERDDRLAVDILGAARAPAVRAAGRATQRELGRRFDDERAKQLEDLGRVARPRHAMAPPTISGPTGYNAYSKLVTTPKLPPPPRSPQNRSAFSRLAGAHQTVRRR